MKSRSSRLWGDSRTIEEREGKRTPAPKKRNQPPGEAIAIGPAVSSSSPAALPEGEGERGRSPFGFHPHPPALSIALGDHVKTHMAGAYSDKPNNAPHRLPCESSQAPQECGGSNPPDPPPKPNLFKTANCSEALWKQVVLEGIQPCIYKLKIRCIIMQWRLEEQQKGRNV